MRLIKILAIVIAAFHFTVVLAENIKINEMVLAVVKNSSTEFFRALYFLKKNPKSLGSGDEEARQLVIALLARKNNVKSILQNNELLMKSLIKIFK